MPEIVYLLTNPTMPDQVKIGRTSDLESRLRSLSTHSGVPVPFECFYASFSDVPQPAIHATLSRHQRSSTRDQITAGRGGSQEQISSISTPTGRAAIAPNPSWSRLPVNYVAPRLRWGSASSRYSSQLSDDAAPLACFLTFLVSSAAEAMLVV